MNTSNYFSEVTDPRVTGRCLPLLSDILMIGLCTYLTGGTVQYVNMPVEIDEKTLTQIAGTTEGNYFRATSNSKLKEVYEEIDKLEKTKLNVKEYSKRQEEYRWFALAAFLCVLLEVLLRNSILKKIP